MLGDESQAAASVNDLVGAQEQARRDVEAVPFCGAYIDDQLENIRLHDR